VGASGSRSPARRWRALVSVLTPDLRVHPDPDAVAAAAAAHIAQTLRVAARRAGGAAIALAGGATPRRLYERLAMAHADDVPWHEVHVWWGDERYVPTGHAHSNYRMAREALLDRVPIPRSQVHPMPTTPSDPDAAARAYEQALVRAWGASLPRFDVIVLGLGTDGHTASLFPGNPALHDTTRRVAVTQAPSAPVTRLTLTYPVLNNGASVQFVVTGAQKAPAVHRVLRGACAPDECPASGVRPSGGELFWWLDAAAARQISG
jgi:6-phosphogluconolactonase